ncbi:carboxypeptidase B-like [Actinia tenebrosa]|uniref:Carboxypeptidase B-like n=1 Tax=Actinia tenebrosa TaxID=6105 RepID=A0A6P8HVA7_ACTTE|nr:carboxypeptidase B-like [Actinia tenebrosa]
MEFMFFFVLLVALGAHAEQLGRVIRAYPASDGQVNYLNNLADNNNLGLDFWTHPSHPGKPVDIRVAHDNHDQLTKLLKSQAIDFIIQIPDVDVAKAMQNPAGSSRAGVFDYFRYNTLDQIVAEMGRLVQTRPNIASMFSVGTSYQGRQMNAIKLSSGAGKKTLFMNCGIHAREWITPATCMYMLNQIITKYGSDSSITAMLNKLDIVIMPVLNVDGYVYTWTSDRMWRKTRSPQGNGCYGADPNRNFNAKWAGPGTSSNPCRDTYHGSRPFSEIETRNVAHYLYGIRSKLVGYLDIHAYSQLWMTPWGHARGAYPPTYQEMMRVANIAVRTLYGVHRTSYRAGSVADIIYAATGGTMDWVAGTLGVTYSYGLELRDKGRYGFLLPANQIRPTGEETFAAIKAMVQEMRI